MKTDKLIKQLELLSDSCESNYALEVNGYTQGVKDSIDVIKNSSLTEVVKSLPQDNFCEICNLPTDGEKCYSKRCPI